MPNANSNCIVNDHVNDYEPSADWHVVLYRTACGQFLAKGGDSLFPSKFEASKFAKAATKADGMRRLVARVVRRYKRQAAAIVRDDYMS